ncbi:hypothetical protein GQ53DRAFT_429353 [Thozetella sp. PMI_491]|nr:hypothetical protein GQ53DRAFT_429353 [Thozetella sp. PMI_491]
MPRDATDRLDAWTARHRSDPWSTRVFGSWIISAPATSRPLLKRKRHDEGQLNPSLPLQVIASCAGGACLARFTASPPANTSSILRSGQWFVQGSTHHAGYVYIYI